jgi:hypothetical protein
MFSVIESLRKSFKNIKMVKSFLNILVMNTFEISFDFMFWGYNFQRYLDFILFLLSN